MNRALLPFALASLAVGLIFRDYHRGTQEKRMEKKIDALHDKIDELKKTLQPRMGNGDLWEKAIDSLKHGS